ncbi:MAG: hydrolase Nlp/P60 [Clostridiales bacterium]|nr:hydrolase Nlp/P60 [Clostridiales bacterium]
MYKRTAAAILVILLFVSMAGQVYASSISDLKKQKQEAQNQLDAISGSLSDLQDEKSGIDSEISDLNSQIVEILASIDLMKEDIAVKEEEIAEAQAEYEAAVAKEKEQYEAMKKRIRFMYEKGDQTYVQLFFESRDLSDMLNKADYIERLYEYDRRMLEEYQKTKQDVADLKEQLEVERDELEAQKFELEEEQAASEEMLAQMKAEASNYEVQIAQAKQQAAAYKALIKQQDAEIKRLEEEERKRAEEEARRKAEAAAKKNGSSSKQTYTATEASKSFDMSQIDSAAGSARGKEVAKFACQFIGNPYVPGGTSLTNGADCSGFTQSVYKNFGYSIPRNSSAQRAYGREVSLNDAEPGDIVCYAGHVAIYVGNGKIVHASTQRTGIKISYVTYRPVLSVRRIV